MGDIPDRISQTFQECGDCGGYFVRVASHQCGTGDTGSTGGTGGTGGTGSTGGTGPTGWSGGSGGSDPTREERVRRASRDPRPETERVALLPARTIDGSYAYHEIDEEGLPVCGGGGGGGLDDEQWIQLPRGDAKARGKSPCGTCWSLTRGSDESVS